MDKMTKLAGLSDAVSQIKGPDLTRLAAFSDAVSQIKGPDLTRLAAFSDAVNQIKGPDLTRLAAFSDAVSQIKGPDLTRLAAFSGAVSQIKGPDLTRLAAFSDAVSQIKGPDLTRLTAFSDALNQIKGPDLTRLATFSDAVNQIKGPSMEKFVPLIQSISTFSDKLAEIDWRSIEFTAEDITLSRDILESENAEELLSKELNENKDPNKISNSIKSVILFIYHFALFLAAVTQVAQYVENTVIPIVQSYTHQEKEGVFQSEKIAIKWLNDELSKDVSNQITKNFRIVIKDDLIVREGMARDSRIAGKLNTGHVVQIVEKRKNWSYVIYSNYEEGEIIEGWVFTRYLRQIK